MLPSLSLFFIHVHLSFVLYPQTVSLPRALPQPSVPPRIVISQLLFLLANTPSLIYWSHCAGLISAEIALIKQLAAVPRFGFRCLLYLAKLAGKINLS